jgi:hypothetical protein
VHLKHNCTCRTQAVGFPWTPLPAQAPDVDGQGKEPLSTISATNSRPAEPLQRSPMTLPWTPMQRTYDSLRPKLQLSGLKRGRAGEGDGPADQEAGLDTLERRIRRRGDVAIGSAERRIWKVITRGNQLLCGLIQTCLCRSDSCCSELGYCFFQPLGMCNYGRFLELTRFQRGCFGPYPLFGPPEHCLALFKLVDTCLQYLRCVRS